MTLEEYRAKLEADPDWAPGWEAVEQTFAGLYPGQEPSNNDTLSEDLIQFGGREYLERISIYDSPKGYKHLVTYGMSMLHANEEYFGTQWSGWGYELTMKVKEQSAAACQWALSVLTGIARFTYQTQRFFTPVQVMLGSGAPLNQEDGCQITSLLVVYDTEAQGKDTLHGRLDFIQLVGITTEEAEALENEELTPQELLDRMKADNPDLVTDMRRTKSYLEGGQAQ